MNSCIMISCSAVQVQCLEMYVCITNHKWYNLDNKNFDTFRFTITDAKLQLQSTVTKLNLNLFWWAWSRRE